MGKCSLCPTLPCRLEYVFSGREIVNGIYRWQQVCVASSTNIKELSVPCALAARKEGSQHEHNYGKSEVIIWQRRKIF